MSFISGLMNSQATSNAADATSAATTAASQTQADASNYAADLQSQSSDQSIQVQWDMFMKQQENMAPWLESGKNALGTLNQQMQPGGEFSTSPSIPSLPTYGLKEFYDDPLYKVMMNQQGNILAQNRAGAASGGSLGSGNQMVALQALGGQNAEGYYQQGFNNRQTMFGDEFSIYNAQVNQQATDYNRLASMAGVGQVAATQINAAGQNTANNISGTTTATGNNLSNIAMNAGNNAASAQMNLGNILGNKYTNQASNNSNMVGGVAALANYFGNNNGTSGTDFGSVNTNISPAATQTNYGSYTLSDE